METRNDENWQVTRSALNLRMEEMLNDGRHSDVTFVTDDRMKIPAHRCILDSVSPVFRAMFASPMIEETTRTVRIVDLSSSGLRAFLRLLYTEELERQVYAEFGLDLLAACHKYQTPPHLIKTVSSLVGETITVENSVRVFEHGSFYDDEALLSCSKTFMFRNWKSVVHTPEFEDLAVKKPALHVELVRNAALNEPITSDGFVTPHLTNQSRATGLLWIQAKQRAQAYRVARRAVCKALLEAQPACKIQIEAYMAKNLPMIAWTMRADMGQHGLQIERVDGSVASLLGVSLQPSSTTLC